MTDVPEFIGADEVADIAHRSVVTVHRAFRRGELRGWKFHRRWMTTPEHVRDWLLRGAPSGETDDNS